MSRGAGLQGDKNALALLLLDASGRPPDGGGMERLYRSMLAPLEQEYEALKAHPGYKATDGAKSDLQVTVEKGYGLVTAAAETGDFTGAMKKLPAFKALLHKARQTAERIAHRAAQQDQQARQTVTSQDGLGSPGGVLIADEAGITGTPDEITECRKLKEEAKKFATIAKGAARGTADRARSLRFGGKAVAESEGVVRDAEAALKSADQARTIPDAKAAKVAAERAAARLRTATDLWKQAADGEKPFKDVMAAAQKVQEDAASAIQKATELAEFGVTCLNEAKAVLVAAQDAAKVAEGVDADSLPKLQEASEAASAARKRADQLPHALAEAASRKAADELLAAEASSKKKAQPQKKPTQPKVDHAWEKQQAEKRKKEQEEEDRIRLRDQQREAERQEQERNARKSLDFNGLKSLLQKARDSKPNPDPHYDAIRQKADTGLAELNTAIANFDKWPLEKLQQLALKTSNLINEVQSFNYVAPLTPAEMRARTLGYLQVNLPILTNNETWQGNKGGQLAVEVPKYSDDPVLWNMIKNEFGGQVVPNHQTKTYPGKQPGDEVKYYVTQSSNSAGIAYDISGHIWRNGVDTFQTAFIFHIPQKR